MKGLVLIMSKGWNDENYCEALHVDFLLAKHLSQHLGLAGS